jgi:hypothetical protein
VRQDEEQQKALRSSPSVICNNTDSYWPVGTILYKNCVEKAEVYIRKDGMLKEKSFSAYCDRIWRRLAGQMVLVNSIICKQESLNES